MAVSEKVFCKNVKCRLTKCTQCDIVVTAVKQESRVSTLTLAQ